MIENKLCFKFKAVNYCLSKQATRLRQVRVLIWVEKVCHLDKVLKTVRVSVSPSIKTITKVLHHRTA